jgi:four helix bundle protein
MVSVERSKNAVVSGSCDVYQLAHKIAVDIHKLSLLLPKHELYECGSQMRRASKSISANIVEGYGRRRYKAEFIKFLVYAHSSCDETTEWLEYIRDCCVEHQEKAALLLKDMEIVGRKLSKFIEAVELKHLS